MGLPLLGATTGPALGGCPVPPLTWPVPRMRAGSGEPPTKTWLGPSASVLAVLPVACQTRRVTLTLEPAGDECPSVSAMLVEMEGEASIAYVQRAEVWKSAV